MGKTTNRETKENAGEVIVKKTEIGEGVFANREFKKGENVFEFKGEVVKGDDIPEIINPEDDRFMQIGEDLYIGRSGNTDDLFNHSCNPNSGMFFVKSEEGGGKRTRYFLRAIKNIKKDEEITWDYSTTMDEDGWEMDCLCGSKNCRHKIRDFKYLPKKVQDNYIRKGMVPSYIIEGLKE